MKKPKIIPRGKYILVKPDVTDEHEQENGLIIPDSVDQEQKAQGIVEAVSPEIKDVKVGDKVIFGVFAGETLKQRENGKDVEYKLLHDDDVIAFMK